MHSEQKSAHSAVTVRICIIVRSRKNLHTCKLPLAGSRSPLVKYARGSHIGFHSTSQTRSCALRMPRYVTFTFIPLIMASSSVRIICWESFAGRNQQVSSTTAPVARELVSTHTLTHHLPRAGSSLRTLVRTSLIMVLRGASSILSSHPAVTSDAPRLMNTIATRSQPPTGRCPTNLPHSENTFRHVTTRGMSGILFPLLQ